MSDGLDVRDLYVSALSRKLVIVAIGCSFLNYSCLCVHSWARVQHSCKDIVMLSVWLCARNSFGDFEVPLTPPVL